MLMEFATPIDVNYQPRAPTPELTIEYADDGADYRDYRSDSPDSRANDQRRSRKKSSPVMRDEKPPVLSIHGGLSRVSKVQQQQQPTSGARKAHHPNKSTQIRPQAPVQSRNPESIWRSGEYLDQRQIQAQTQALQRQAQVHAQDYQAYQYQAQQQSQQQLLDPFHPAEQRDERRDIQSHVTGIECSPERTQLDQRIDEKYIARFEPTLMMNGVFGTYRSMEPVNLPSNWGQDPLN